MKLIKLITVPVKLIIALPVMINYEMRSTKALQAHDMETYKKYAVASMALQSRIFK